MGRIKKNRIRYREEEILDFNNIELNNNNKKERKLRKKVINRIQKEKRRNRAFSYLIKYIGRGANNSLKRLYQMNKKDEITKTYLKREEIEEELISYKKKYYKKVFNILIYKDKI